MTSSQIDERLSSENKKFIPRSDFSGGVAVGLVLGQCSVDWPVDDDECATGPIVDTGADNTGRCRLPGEQPTERVDASQRPYVRRIFYRPRKYP